MLPSARAARRVLLLSAALALGAAAPAGAGVALSTSGWEWSDPLPQGYTLDAVGFQGGTGFLAGAGGTVLKTTDGGATFTGLFTGTGLTIDAIDMVSADALAVRTISSESSTAARCSLLVSKDGGASFRRVVIGTSDTSCSGNEITAFDFVTGDLGYVMRSGGVVLKTTDGGATLGNASTVDGGLALAFVSDTKGFALGAAGIYKTTDGAQTWAVAKAATGLQHLTAYDANTLLAWGGGKFLRSTDGGDTWAEVNGLIGNPSAISGYGTTRLAYVLDGKLYLSDDAGATAKVVTVGNSDILAAAWLSDTRVIAVGTAGVTYVSTDGGTTFTRTSSEPVGPQIDAILGTGGGPVAAGVGKIARLVNGSWKVLQTLSGGKVSSADFSSATNGYVLHADGSLVRTTTGGVTWSRVDAGTPSAPRLVMTPDDDTVLLFGSFGVYRATGGGSFSKVAGPNGRGLWTAGHAGKRVGYVTNTGQRKNRQFLLSANGGRNWRTVAWPKSLPARITYLTVLPGKGLLATAEGKLYRSADDRGTRWAEVVAGADANGLAQIQAATASEYFAVADETWGAPVILHTVNAGRTWQPQAVGAAKSYITRLVADGPKRAFAISYGDNRASIFQTTTGGQRGSASTVSLARTKSTLKRLSGSTVQIVGQLSGGTGGEQVRVAVRRNGDRAWRSVLVTVGANGGGSFTANLKVKKGVYTVVAGWAGDSGRAGVMTAPKTVTVR